MSTTLPRNPENTTAVLDVTGYRATRRAWVAAGPGRAYDLLSTVSNLGRWSPDAIRAQYEEGAGSWAGAWFRGRNQRGGAEWDSRSQVQEVVHGVEFTYIVLGSAPVPSSTGAGPSPPTGRGPCSPRRGSCSGRAPSSAPPTRTSAPRGTSPSGAWRAPSWHWPAL